MTIFVDTAALFALLDDEDRHHAEVAEWFRGPGADPTLELRTHNYVVVEAAALVHRRLGAAALQTLLVDLVPTLTQRFVDEALHRQATSAYLAGRRRGSSLVDRVSFEVMRAESITTAFTVDADFEAEGFSVVP